MKRRVICHALVLLVVTAAGCNNNNGSSLLSAEASSVSDAAVGELYDSLQKSVQSNPRLLGQVQTAIGNPFNITTRTDAVGLQIAAVQRGLKAHFGSMANFMEKANVDPGRVSKEEIKGYLLASQLRQSEQLGVFANRSQAERLGILASSLKVAVFLREKTRVEASGLALDSAADGAKAALATENWYLVAGGAAQKPDGTVEGVTNASVMWWEPEVNCRAAASDYNDHLFSTDTQWTCVRAVSAIAAFHQARPPGLKPPSIPSPPAPGAPKPGPDPSPQ